MAKPSSEPYIGGAEKARREARKQMHRPQPRHNIHPNKRHRANNEPRLLPFPKSMKPHDRFFGSLLSSSIESFNQSQVNDRKHEELMNRCCSLLNVPSLPPAPIKTSFHRSVEKNCDARSHHLLQRSSSFLSDASFASTSSLSPGVFDNAKSYYMSKAPLILEESRCIIADALHRQTYSKNNGCSLSLQLAAVDEKYSKMKHVQFAPLLLSFKIEKVVTEKEKGMSWSRPGNVFVLKPPSTIDGSKSKDSDEAQSALLACVAPMAQIKSEDGKSSYFSLMIFRRDDFDLSQFMKDDDSNSKGNDKAMFQAVALTTLISQVRQMEACLRMTKVSFMSKLLGCKKSKHIRFNDDEEEEVINEDDSMGEEVIVDDEVEFSDNSDHEKDNNLQNLWTKLPKLNPTQEKAATKFLTSLPASLILVQGPPGTGKSTFLVNVICRRLITDPNARILVTAPTNKAVTVLAQRFLDVINSIDDSTFNDVNPVLVGVEDKLVNEEQYFSPDVMTTSLRSIFAYTWIQSVKTEWLVLLEDMEKFIVMVNDTSDATIEDFLERAKKMQSKLNSGIPTASSDCSYDVNEVVQRLEAAVAAKIWKESMKECSDELDIDTSTALIEDAICHCRNIRGFLHDIESVDVVPELLATARVIFCTLSTAGSSILKQTPQVDDLLVDEAAAATEAELCIPFHLRPKRMLAVGDPMQLPPTIISRRASDLGLSKSMHDRLMNDCDEEYFMLDQQYRMVPDISRFPCSQFYDGMITDGHNVTCETYSRQTYLHLNKPYSFVHVQGNEYKGRCGSYANNEECAKILDILEAMRQNSSGAVDWDSHDKLRIITFYQAQNTLLKSLLAKRKLHKVLVATVDSSQGCEADTVIVSFTRSNNKMGVLQAAGFLADDRRINVAVTRARHQLICVGNADTLGSEGSESLKQLVLDAKHRLVVTESTERQTDDREWKTMGC